MDRKAYWNETYREYWLKRVAESQTADASGVVEGDIKTEPDEVYRRIFQTVPFVPGRLLDVGCAWGRMFPLYLEAGMRISGVDISSAMIEIAHRDWATHADVDAVLEAEAEDLPFPDASFENVACIAVFDATLQHKSLREFLRVLKPGGRLYLTGKNASYEMNDELALAAEAGARRKGHPNFFTDFARMRTQLEECACRVIASWFFRRRGDFFAFEHVLRAPEYFYDWMIVVERGTEPSPMFTPFSNEQSATFTAVSQS